MTEQTLLCGLALAAKKAQEIIKAPLHDLPVTEVQVDVELHRAETVPTNGSRERRGSPRYPQDGPQWVWISFAPPFRLILASFVGPRTFESALTLIQRTTTIVRGVPCFFSDGFSSYLRALIASYHQIKEFPRTGKRGRPRKPELEAHPDLVYAQVVKR